MNLPWEAIVAVVIALIGFIAWLTKISVMQDVGLEKTKTIINTITVIEATYVKGVDFSKEIGRLEQSIIAAHKRIDVIRKSGYDTNKQIGEREG